jgi:hypothetical protein
LSGPDDDVWLRLRFRRSLLPRHYPAGIPEAVLLKRALKTLRRAYGLELVALHGWGYADVPPDVFAAMGDGR